ncbi:cell wall hydrolase [Paenibacillus sp. CAA11]|uniref:cell wall hydrolase n=1 Tax=Paenibacillus sp. CAA11 TaxID=1532905 RepID=UPI000D34F95D|nr:cell wall hydrolase [Paenibacillus sp. CAA11]AWB43608.1 cell wall hydrolase [Paenibacillus sp. CAA11]
MYLFRQSRYVTLLISAILVCLGSIYLLWMPINPAPHGKRSELKLSAGEKPDIRRIPAMVSTQPILIYEQTKAATLFLLKPAALQQRAKVLPTYRSILPAGRAQALVQKAAPAVSLAIDKSQPPEEIFFTRTKLLSPEERDQATWTYAVSKEELLLLQKIVMAEAEGEPYEGKVAVANVVLNRLRSANYPDSIKEVIYQKYQFSPVRNGRMSRVKPNKDTIRAVTEALYGRKEVSDDTYYFLSLKLASDLTVHHHQKKTKTIGNHTFYK